MTEYDDESISHQIDEHDFTNNNTENFSIGLEEQDMEGENKFIEQERLSLLWKLFDDNQRARYEKYKTSGIENRKKNRSTTKIDCPRTKKIVQNILGENVPLNNQVQIVLQGIAKIYAGELVEEAKMILCEKLGPNDKIPPIKPEHLREARRRMLQRKILPTVKMKYLFQDK